MHHLARIRFPRHHGHDIVDDRTRTGFGIETQIALALVLVGAVTLEAFIGKDWPNIAVEVDRYRFRIFRTRCLHGNE